MPKFEAIRLFLVTAFVCAIANFGRLWNDAVVTLVMASAQDHLFVLMAVAALLTGMLIDNVRRTLAHKPVASA